MINIKTIRVKLEPCCIAMDGAIACISVISNSLNKNEVRLGVRIGIEQLTVFFCPWCGKEVELKVID